MKENQASSTALLIATGLSYLSRARNVTLTVPREARLLSDWVLRSYSPLTRGTLRCLDFTWSHFFIRRLEGLTVPRISEHYVARKLALERLVREGSGIRQLVVLGAGFDSLALRMVADLPDLKAIEIDHPATQAWKKKGIEACQMGSPRLNFQALDLSLSLDDDVDLFRPFHRREEATFWIAEGLLMYFPQQKVERLFGIIRQVSAAGSRFAFTFMEPQSDGRVDFRQTSRGVRLWLKQQQEPFAWGIRRRNLSSFLNGLGFRLMDIPSHLTQEVDRLNVGEYVALAEVC